MTDHGKRWCLTREGRQGWTDIWVGARDVPRYEADGWTVKQKYEPPKPDGSGLEGVVLDIVDEPDAMTTTDE
ncbi:MAG: hypothetical protein ABFS30_07450 [Pseudomonadota bacterium]